MDKRLVRPSGSNFTYIPIPKGKGSYGHVDHIGHYAVKTFTKEKDLLKEYAALTYLKNTQCQYIVKVVDVNVERQQLSMELYDTDLKDWYKSNVRDPDYPLRGQLLIHDILCGIIELHDRGLAHGDLKPGNILVQLQPLRAVLGDAGFVSIAKYTKTDHTGPIYCDPVPLKTAAHDLFSLGIILFELVTGQKINYLANHDVYQLLAQTHVKDRTYRKIIINLLQADHSQRYSARALLQKLFKENYPQWTVPDLRATIVLDPVTKSFFVGAAKNYGVPRTGLGRKLLAKYKANQREKTIAAKSAESEFYTLIALPSEPDSEDRLYPSLFETGAMLRLLTILFLADPLVKSNSDNVVVKAASTPNRFTTRVAVSFANCTISELSTEMLKMINDPEVLQGLMTPTEATRKSPESSSSSVHSN
jgi:serine/threonine protein kinase